MGARFVDDVSPYELIKSRLLNGTHSALGYLGYLAGHRNTEQAMNDPSIRGYVEQLITRELAPGSHLTSPGMEFEPYCATLLDRLGNPAIADPLLGYAGAARARWSTTCSPRCTRTARGSNPIPY